MAWEFKVAITAFVVLIGCYVVDNKFRLNNLGKINPMIASIGAGAFITVPVSLLIALWRLA